MNYVKYAEATTPCHINHIYRNCSDSITSNHNCRICPKYSNTVTSYFIWIFAIVFSHRIDYSHYDRTYCKYSATLTPSHIDRIYHSIQPPNNRIYCKYSAKVTPSHIDRIYHSIQPPNCLTILTVFTVNIQPP